MYITRQTAQNLINTAVAAKVNGTTSLTSIYGGTITQNGTGTTPVSLGANVAATLTGSQDAPFTLDDGYTFIVTTDGSEQDITFDGTAGNHTGGTTPVTDLTAEIDTKFKIKADADTEYREVTCDWTGCNDGTKIAAQIEAKIQALTGIYGAVTAIYDTNKYVITSGTLGSASKIRIARADTLDVTDELKIGDSGTNNDGTGDAANLAAATITEALAKINAGMNKLTAVASGSKIKLTSKTTGSASTLAVGDGTGNAALGFTNSDEDTGVTGVGMTGGEAADANYLVFLNLVDSASIDGNDVGVANKTTTGFDIVCENTSSEDAVDVLVIGKPAS